MTNNQYVAFLNAVAKTDTHSLYNTNMMISQHGGIERSGIDGHFSYAVKAGMGNKPVNFVSFWDSARFANWLTNGQPTGLQIAGTTETGVYNLGGVTNPDNTTVTRNAIAWINGGVAVSSNNEWYKAAFFDPTLNNGDGGYWLYSTQSNTAPDAIAPNSSDANSANYGGDDNMGTVTDVGAYTLATSYYGTYDQSGNVFERTDLIVDPDARKMRGGSYLDGEAALASTTGVLNLDATLELFDIGFRVSSLSTIPEPAHMVALMGMVALLLTRTLRRKRS